MFTGSLQQGSMGVSTPSLSSARGCLNCAPSCSTQSVVGGPRRPSKLAPARRAAECAAPVLRTNRPASVVQCLHGVADDRPYDIVLSSGFLAFANHAGFLQAIEEAGVKVGGVMGTSSGALTGALYCAGYTPKQVNMELSRQAPIASLRPTLELWRGGIMSFDRVIERLREVLPPRFEDLEREFAVGVVNEAGDHLIIDSGALPEAVAASAAVPFMFCAVQVPGYHSTLKDGGMVDRVGLRAWRNRRRAQLTRAGLDPLTARTPPAIVHLISRSSPFSGADDVNSMGESNVLVVRSPHASASLGDLGDYHGKMKMALTRLRPQVAEALRWEAPARSPAVTRRRPVGLHGAT